MLTKKDIENARWIMSNLELPEEFGGSEDFDAAEYEDKFSSCIQNDFYISCGVSKMVIVFDDLPFVMKIPFSGRWEMDWENEDKFYFYPFGEACEEDGADYCLDELSKTISIQDEGFGFFVPDMAEIGICCGHNVYIQEKVKPLCDCSKLQTTEDSLKRAKKSRNSFRDDWIARVYDLYGEEVWEKFILFLEDYEPDVLTDMHSGNYGITLDGAPVIFDLSGFRD